MPPLLRHKRRVAWAKGQFLVKILRFKVEVDVIVKGFGRKGVRSKVSRFYPVSVKGLGRNYCETARSKLSKLERGRKLEAEKGFGRNHQVETTRSKKGLGFGRSDLGRKPHTFS